jgi:hypothetical protein
MKGKHAAKTGAGPLQPLKTTHQQRLEELEQLAGILLEVFFELSQEEQARYAPPVEKRKAA